MDLPRVCCKLALCIEVRQKARFYETKKVVLHVFQNLDDIDFRFRDKERPISYTRQLTNALHVRMFVLVHEVIIPLHHHYIMVYL